MNKTFAVGLAAGLSALSLSAAAVTTTYTTNLSPSNEVPPVPSLAVGSFELVLDDSTNLMDFVATAFNLPSGVTGAHIHSGLAGSNGPVVLNLLTNADAVGTVMVGSFSVANSFAMLGEDVLDTTGLIAAINAMPWNYYINIHTNAYPGGELRGQLAMAPVPEPGTYAMLALGLGLLAWKGHRRASRH